MRSRGSELGVVVAGGGVIHFLEEMGRRRQLGRTVEGLRSPPSPAFMRPPPLSRTTTFEKSG